jgi:hypothetical protein
MSKVSLLHESMQNQESSSWNDDPFDLNGSFKGVKSLSHSRNLYLYVEDVVSHYAKFKDECYSVAFSDLPDYAQNELASLYMEFTDRETDCIHGNDFSIDNDFTSALLQMLKNDSRETRELFAETTRKNILQHYQSSLQKLLDEACEDLLHNQYNELGYFSHRCNEEGDVEWRSA